jgi:hypothetical protein
MAQAKNNMSIKEEITIKVPSDIALAYRNASEEEREQIQLKVAAMMQLQLKSAKQEAITRLRNTMDTISAKAQAKGLTPEILELLLNEAE